jgi:hypothetical protein
VLRSVESGFGFHYFVFFFCSLKSIYLLCIKCLSCCTVSRVYRHFKVKPFDAVYQIITLDCENYTEHISTLSELCEEFFRVRAGLPKYSKRPPFFRESVSPLTPNDPYSGRTAPLTFKRCILYIYSTNIGTEYFKHGIYSSFFSLENAVCFIILTYLVPILFTYYIQSVIKLKKK